MAITKEELDRILKIDFDIEKISSISCDGRNYLIRIPKEICNFLELSKKKKIRWLVNTEKKIKLEVINGA